MRRRSRRQNVLRHYLPYNLRNDERKDLERSKDIAQTDKCSLTDPLSADRVNYRPLNMLHRPEVACRWPASLTPQW